MIRNPERIGMATGRKRGSLGTVFIPEIALHEKAISSRRSAFEKYEIMTTA